MTEHDILHFGQNFVLKFSVSQLPNVPPTPNKFQNLLPLLHDPSHTQLLEINIQHF